MTEWVLLVGSSFSAASILLTLREQGFKVAVCGAKPSDPCVAYADAYHALDYSDQEALLQLVKQHGYRYLCPSCNDYAYLSAAYVANRLGLPGYDQPDATAVIHNKARFREAVQQIGVASPKAYRVSDDTQNLIAAMQAPLLVKPCDSFSGRGMQKIEAMALLPEAVEHARAESRSAEVVVEEFVPGSLHSHSAFLANGEIVQDFFVDEFCETYPYQVDCSNSPSRLGHEVQQQVRANIRLLAQTLNLADGLLHTQFISGEKGVFIIECMRRCPGDLYYHLIEYSTGSHYLKNYVAPFIAQPIQVQESRTTAFWARHTLSFDSDKLFFSFAPVVPGALDVRVFPLVESAHLIRHAPYGKAAIAFAQMASASALFDVAPRMGDYFSSCTLEHAHA